MNVWWCVMGYCVVSLEDGCFAWALENEVVEVGLVVSRRSISCISCRVRCRRVKTRRFWWRSLVSVVHGILFSSSVFFNLARRSPPPGLGCVASGSPVQLFTCCFRRTAVQMVPI